MVFNTTDISSVVICNNLEEYENLVNSDSYEEFALYIVEVSDNQLLVFYGRRRLTDILVIDSLPPNLPESPINKFYLLVDSINNDEVQVQNIYYKYLKEFRQPKVAQFLTSYISSFSEGTLGTFDMIFSDNSKATVLLSTEEGLLSDSAVQSIVKRIRERVMNDNGIDANGDIFWYEWS